MNNRKTRYGDTFIPAIHGYDTSLTIKAGQVIEHSEARNLGPQIMQPGDLPPNMGMDTQDDDPYYEEEE